MRMSESVWMGERWEQMAHFLEPFIMSADGAPISLSTPTATHVTDESTLVLSYTTMSSMCCIDNITHLFGCQYLTVSIMIRFHIVLSTPKSEIKKQS